jgi:anti-sigma-K factor RskA
MEENIEELLPFYALGTLSPAEQARVEKYVASHPDSRALLAEMLHSAAALPFAAPAVEPRPALKKQLMDRVRVDATPRPAWPFASWLMPAFSLGSLLVAVAALIWGVSLRSEVLRLRAQTAALEQELNSQRTVLAQLTSPQSKAFAISGTSLQPAAHGQLIADAGTGSAVLIVSGLKPLAASSTYEFWLIQGKNAVPAGLFNVDSEGRAILQVPSNPALASYNAVGVSIEPAGGSKQPSKNIVMLGNFY